jgi:formate dehydrogenase
MVPHYSGTTLDAQARYASGVKSILENYFNSKPQDPANIIVGIGKYETKACKCLFHYKQIECLLVFADGQR